MKKSLLSEQNLHNVIKKSIKKVIKEAHEGDDEYIYSLAEEALSLADQLYFKLEEMCDECRRNINEPLFDEYELEEIRDSAENVMNGLGEMFGDPEIYGSEY